MNPETKIALLQNVYAAALAESINTYDHLGAHAAIVDSRKRRHPASALRTNQWLGARNARDVIEKLSTLFGCANWQVDESDTSLTATAKACKLCALSKQMGGANPCDGWCLDPMYAMIEALEAPGVNTETFTVHETLFDGKQCKISMTKKKGERDETLDLSL